MFAKLKRSVFGVTKALFISSLFLIFSAAQANATTFEYFVRGNVAAPIIVTLNGQERNPGNATFSLDFDNANVILTYDDRGTSSVADDIMLVQGTVSGEITYPGYGQGQLSNYHFIVGQYDFELDLAASNPIQSLTSAPGTNFAFGQQAAGTIELLNPPLPERSNWGYTSTLMLKNDQNFALNVFPSLTTPGTLDGVGWIAVMDGFLGIGNGSRWEFGAKNAFLNWDFSLVPTGRQVPEPMTAGLLSLGLLGGALTRKKYKAN
jgi:hypothetical protein